MFRRPMGVCPRGPLDGAVADPRARDRVGEFFAHPIAIRLKKSTCDKIWTEAWTSSSKSCNEGVSRRVETE
jgi:hypothetical protein